jgi:hypothetical protein
MRLLLTAAAACAALLLIATAAMAKGRDGNHDGLPDRWERSHHLSLQVNQAKRDQDHDGLRNRAEFRLGTNPRDDDSDEDGVEDGAEGAGTVTSFDGTTLTITLFKGGTLTGAVNANTEIECGDREDGDDHEDAGDDSRIASVRDDGGDDAGDAQGDDDAGDACDPALLKTGAIVREAELSGTTAGAAFEKVELMTAPAG